MISDELRDFAETPPPRHVTEEIRRAVPRRTRGTRIIGFAGFFFLAFSMPFLYIFFPWKIVEELQLDWGSSKSVEGRISDSLETNMNVNGRKVYEIHFEYRPDGQAETLGGQCYADQPYRPGKILQVEYLPAKSGSARIRGGRLNAFGYFTSFVIVFPCIGVLLIWVAIRSKMTRSYLLAEGHFAMGEITAPPRRRSMSSSSGPMYDISIRLQVDGEEYVKRTVVAHDAAETIKAMHEDSLALHLLYDPRMPKRFLWLDEK